MTGTSNWSVTLTGAVLHQAQADAVWPKVAALLGGDVESLRSRLPVTFKPLDEASARRQWDELNALGAEAMMLPDDGGPRLWVRVDERTCGPVSQAYARHAHDRGQWHPDALACLHGHSDWQPLRALLDLPAEAVPPVPPSLPGARMGGDGLLPTFQEMPLLHAGFWMRVASYIVDSIITSVALFVVLFIILMITGVDRANYQETGSAIDLLFVIAVWLYFALFESSSLQATPGKLALGLRVTDDQGRRIGFGRATGRYFGKIISGLILGIGYMMAGWTRRKQALHDMMAGCCVVRATGLASLKSD